MSDTNGSSTITTPESRALGIFKNLRCIDCSNSGQSIESSETFCATEMRACVRTMIRKKKTDIEIYHEISNIYGKYSVLGIHISDRSAKVDDIYTHITIRLLYIIPSSLFLVFLGKKIFFKRFFTKK